MPLPPHHPTPRGNNLHPHDRKSTAVMGISILHITLSPRPPSKALPLNPKWLSRVPKSPPKNPKNGQKTKFDLVGVTFQQPLIIMTRVVAAAAALLLLSLLSPAAARSGSGEEPA